MRPVALAANLAIQPPSGARDHDIGGPTECQLTTTVILDDSPSGDVHQMVRPPPPQQDPPVVQEIGGAQGPALFDPLAVHGHSVDRAASLALRLEEAGLDEQV